MPSHYYFTFLLSRTDAEKCRALRNSIDIWDFACHHRRNIEFPAEVDDVNFTQQVRFANAAERLIYMKEICPSLRINYLTKVLLAPFTYYSVDCLARSAHFYDKFRPSFDSADDFGEVTFLPPELLKKIHRAAQKISLKPFEGPYNLAFDGLENTPKCNISNYGETFEKFCEAIDFVRFYIKEAAENDDYLVIDLAEN